MHNQLELSTGPENDQWDELLRQIQGLPQQEQYVMSMRFEHGMSMAEIAAVLEINEGEVKRIYWRAIDKLRPSLERI